jgi:hypothetical protein
MDRMDGIEFALVSLAVLSLFALVVGVGTLAVL